MTAPLALWLLAAFLLGVLASTPCHPLLKGGLIGAVLFALRCLLP